jgi:hypothetical protein
MSNNFPGFSQSAINSDHANQKQGYGTNINQSSVRNEPNSSNAEQQLSKEEVVTLLAQIEEMVKTAALPDSKKEDAIIAYLTAAKEATEKEEPKKHIAAGNLKEMADTLKKASETFDAGESLWEKVQPHLGKIVIWLGTAAASFW